MRYLATNTVFKLLLVLIVVLGVLWVSNKKSPCVFMANHELKTSLWIHSRDNRIFFLFERDLIYDSLGKVDRTNASTEQDIEFSFVKGENQEQAPNYQPPSPQYDRFGLSFQHDAYAIDIGGGRKRSSSINGFGCAYWLAIVVLLIPLFLIARNRIWKQLRNIGVFRRIGREIVQSAAGLCGFLLICAMTLTITCWALSYAMTPSIERSHTWFHTGVPWNMLTFYWVRVQHGQIRLEVQRDSLIAPEKYLPLIDDRAYYIVAANPIRATILAPPAEHFGFLFDWKARTTQLPPKPEKSFPGELVWERAGNFSVPCWFLTGIQLAILYPWMRARRKRRQRRQRAVAGACLACGYDLRGSPARCPECGTVSLEDRDVGESTRPVTITPS
ncbi:MAG TPA: hypothetical protein VFE47_13260 [Tepidisphaeraceae bacterium]|jgi:heme/copper-type cytochrome/quinol oxidase subunit 4|nr:hypothetical protein [Tepidisphaeraceae bacterium]